MMAIIRFSNHALDQLRERNISRAAVVRSVQRLRHVTHESRHRFRTATPITRSDKRYALVVVFERTKAETVIVTAFYSSKINKYL